MSVHIVLSFREANKHSGRVDDQGEDEEIDTPRQQRGVSLRHVRFGSQGLVAMLQIYQVARCLATIGPDGVLEGIGPQPLDGHVREPPGVR